MPTGLPQVSIKAADGGWLTACNTCDHESWHYRRPAADRVAHEHRASHAAKAGGR